jgi:hypothetical protein
MGNGNVNDRGKIIFSSAAPKDTSMGKSTAKDATNVVGGTQVTSKPLSPYACTPNK